MTLHPRTFQAGCAVMDWAKVLVPESQQSPLRRDWERRTRRKLTASENGDCRSYLLLFSSSPDDLSNRCKSAWDFEEKQAVLPLRMGEEALYSILVTVWLFQYKGAQQYYNRIYERLTFYDIQCYPVHFQVSDWKFIWSYCQSLYRVTSKGLHHEKVRFCPM